MATLMERPEAGNRSAKSKGGGKIGLLRMAAATSSMLCILVSLAGSSLFETLGLGFIGIVLATWDVLAFQRTGAGRQVLAFSLLALIVGSVLWVVAHLLGMPLLSILVSIAGVGAWIVLYSSGYLRLKEPELEGKEDEGSGVSEAKRSNPRLLLAASALLAGLSIVLPAIILGIFYPLNKAEWRFVNIVNQRWVGEVWWPYVLTGVALSVVFSLAAVTMALRSRLTRGGADAYGSTVVKDMKTSRSWSIVANVALLFALLVAIPAPWAPNAEWVGVVLTSMGLVAIAIGIRPVARTASLVLPFAMVALMMGPWAIIPNGYDSAGVSPDAAVGVF